MKNCFSTLLLSLLSVLVLGPQQALADVARASVDTPWVYIGQPRILHLEVTVPEGTAVEWPLQAQQGGFLGTDFENNKITYGLEFALDADFTIDTVLVNGGMVTMSQDIKFLAFDSAAMTMGPFTFVLDGGKSQLSTEMLALRCDQPFDLSQADPDSFQDLKNVMRPAFVIWDYIWWVPIVQAIFTICVVGGYLIHRWRKKRKLKAGLIPEPEAPALPPHIVAMDALEDLNRRKLWQEGQFKAFHTELTDILRKYIEGRYQMAALEKTTDEIMAELVELQIHQKSSYNNLHEVLKLADLVKFAKYEPLADENQLSMVNARLFVEQTKEVIVEKVQSEPKADAEVSADTIQSSIQ